MSGVQDSMSFSALEARQISFCALAAQVDSSEVPADLSFPTERRSTERSMRIFMPACIETESASLAAILRDISVVGAGFEAEHDLKVGQELSYRWGDEPPCQSKVIWVEGSRFGVQNETVLPDLRLDPSNYRSVRIPLSAPVSIFLEGRRLDGELLNFAQKGFCASIANSIARGALATVKVGRHQFENVTTRWVEEGRAGFSLPVAMPVPQMSRLLQGA